MLGRSTHQEVRGRPVDWRPQRYLAALPAKLLVSSGILMFALYLFMDVVASLSYDGYSYKDQTISELSAIGAPTTRNLMRKPPERWRKLDIWAAA